MNDRIRNVNMGMFSIAEPNIKGTVSLNKGSTLTIVNCNFKRENFYKKLKTERQNRLFI